MAEDPDGIALPLVWIDPDETDISFVNQVLVQRQNDEYILTFGQQTPPILMGSPEENMERAKEIAYIPVRVAVRLGFTANRMAEFLELIQSAVERSKARDGEA